MEHKKRAATRDEFYQTVEEQFSFLVSDHGYTSERKNAPSAVEFKNQTLSIRISSNNYGFSVELEVLVDGQSLPIWPIVSRMADRKIPVTDKPQLDEIKEYAWRIRHECLTLLEGDEVLIGSIRDAIREEEKKFEYQHEHFFNIADILYEAGQYSACLKHFRQCPYEITPEWEKRLAYAQENSSEQ